MWVSKHFPIVVNNVCRRIDEKHLGVYVAVKFGGNDTILVPFLTKLNSDWGSVHISIKRDVNTIINHAFVVVFVGVWSIMIFIGGDVVFDFKRCGWFGLSFVL